MKEKEINKKKKIVSVVLGTYNRLRFLRLAIKSIRDELKDYGDESEIIVVDGGSTDGTIDWLTKQKDIISIIQHNRGRWIGKEIRRRSWGYFMNLGFKCAQGKYVCMVSDDCLVVLGSIKNGVSLFEKELKKRQKVGAVAFYFRDWPFVKKYHVNVNFGKTYLNHGLYLRSALEKVGYANEDDYSFYGSDIDLNMKMAEKGYRCLVSERSFVEHFADANNLIRNTNVEAAKNDANMLRERWGKKYGELGGEWRQKSFMDLSKTADGFKLPLVLEYKNQFLRSPIRFVRRIREYLKRRIENVKK